MTSNKKMLSFVLALFLCFFSISCHDLTSSSIKPEPEKTEQILAETVPASELPEPSEEISPDSASPEDPLVINTEIIQAQGSRIKCRFGVKMSTDGSKPCIPTDWKSILDCYSGFYLLPTEQKIVYFTFDLGYEAGFTAKLLDLLKDLEIPALFFLTGYYIQTQPQLVLRMLEEGHEVGNHSHKHESLPSLSKEEIIEDTQTVEKLFFDLTGQKMRAYRPPSGHFSEYSLSILHQMGYESYFWSIAYPDWEKLPGGWQQAYQTVIDHIHPGALILMHVSTDENLKALPDIARTLRDQGYSFALP
jgi:peptidoglycan-N-acetylmuramic acid deacetylase